ncbi:hypothetical protein [Streptomyces sp. NPDC005538]|uniref:hypothetical protein n=1 Tax=unclassified Streptomyces TaxID=2593676 RepID=UPI0033B9C1E0
MKKRRSLTEHHGIDWVSYAASFVVAALAHELLRTPHTTAETTPVDPALTTS